MFKELSNYRATKRAIQNLGHDLGLAVELIPAREPGFIEYRLEVEMNKNRFNGYCHLDADGHRAMTDQARVNQIVAEKKMVFEFWTAMLSELRSINKKIEWLYHGEYHRVFRLETFTIQELRLNDTNGQDRVIRIHL